MTSVGKTLWQLKWIGYTSSCASYYYMTQYYLFLQYCPKSLKMSFSVELIPMIVPSGSVKSSDWLLLKTPSSPFVETEDAMSSGTVTDISRDSTPNDTFRPIPVIVE